MDPEAKLAEMGLTLPAAPKPFASYRPVVQSGKLLFVSGTGPTRDGQVLMRGKLGDPYGVKEGQEAARLSVLNSLAAIRAHTGSLAKVAQVVRATIYVASTPTFVEQPKVADGATDLLRELWGDAGLPARAAVGVPVLPMDIPVEVELAVELR